MSRDLGCRLVLKKDDLDDAFKDKRFPENAKVEILFDKDREIAFSECGMMSLGLFCSCRQTCTLYSKSPRCR